MRSKVSGLLTLSILTMEFLGDTFVKADGSSVDLAYVTQAKIIIVMYTAGGLICALI